MDSHVWCVVQLDALEQVILARLADVLYTQTENVHACISTVLIVTGSPSFHAAAYLQRLIRDVVAAAEI